MHLRIHFSFFRFLEINKHSNKSCLALRGFDSGYTECKCWHGCILVCYLHAAHLRTSMYLQFPREFHFETLHCMPLTSATFSSGERVNAREYQPMWMFASCIGIACNFGSHIFTPRHAFAWKVQRASEDKRRRQPSCSSPPQHCRQQNQLPAMDTDDQAAKTNQI